MSEEIKVKLNTQKLAELLGIELEIPEYKEEDYKYICEELDILFERTYKNRPDISFGQTIDYLLKKLFIFRIVNSSSTDLGRSYDKLPEFIDEIVEIMVMKVEQYDQNQTHN